MKTWLESSRKPATVRLAGLSNASKIAYITTMMAARATFSASMAAARTRGFPERSRISWSDPIATAKAQ